MAGLAAQRRKYGLTASVLDIGMILGIGYIHRTEGDDSTGVVEASLRKENCMPIAERDIHHMLSEAIVAGRANSGHEFEIISGLEKLNLSATERPTWHDNPRFSHQVDEAAISKEHESGATTKSIKQQLSTATTAEGVIDILQNGFSTHLASVLKAWISWC